MACASSAEVNWALAGLGFGLTMIESRCFSSFNRKVLANLYCAAWSKMVSSVLCLNLGNIHLPLSYKKQAGLEIVGLSCQCSVGPFRRQWAEGTGSLHNAKRTLYYKYSALE